MNYRLRVVIAALCLTVCVGCPPKPQLSKRHDSLKVLDASAKEMRADYAKVSMSVRPIPETPAEPAPLALQLSPDGQAALAKSLGGPFIKRSEIIDQLRRPVKDKPALPNETINSTRVQKRIFFSVSRTEDTLPGDRIESLAVTVKMVTPNPTGLAKFRSVTRFETEYQTVDLAKLTTAQTNSGSAGAEISATPHGDLAGAKVTGSLSTSKTLNEEVQLRQRYEALSVQISSDGTELSIFRESIAGIDLTGVFFVDVEIQLPPEQSSLVFAAAPLFKDYVALPPGKLPFVFADVAGTLTTADVTLSSKYRLRRLARGADTIMEGDDKVLLIDKDVPPQMPGVPDTVTLVSNDDIVGSHTFYCIRVAGIPNQTLFVGQSTGAQPIPLLFMSAAGARNFIDWIQSAPATNFELNNRKQLLLASGATWNPVNAAAAPNLVVTPWTAAGSGSRTAIRFEHQIQNWIKQAP